VGGGGGGANVNYCSVEGMVSLVSKKKNKMKFKTGLSTT